MNFHHFIHIVHFHWQNMIGTLMDSNALHSLDAELKELHVATQPVQNVWITEVGCLNPLDEARNILHDLSS